MLKLLTCPRGHWWESDEEASVCPQCGAPAGAPPGPDLAPSEPLPPAVEPAAPPLVAEGKPVVPGYEVLEELGRGRTGLRLYRARQLLCNREVLLEVVLAKE